MWTLSFTLKNLPEITYTMKEKKHSQDEMCKFMDEIMEEARKQFLSESIRFKYDEEILLFASTDADEDLCIFDRAKLFKGGKREWKKWLKEDNYFKRNH